MVEPCTSKMLKVGMKGVQVTPVSPHGLESEADVKVVQIVGNSGTAEGVDDGDGLAFAVESRSIQRTEVVAG